MRILTLTFLTLLAASFASAENNAEKYQGSVQYSTGQLYLASWTACEAQVESQTKETLVMKLRLISSKGPQFFEHTYTLQHKNLNPIIDFKWDYGMSEPAQNIQGTSFSTMLTHRVKLSSGDSKLKYRMRYIEMVDGRNVGTSELNCDLKLISTSDR